MGIRITFYILMLVRFSCSLCTIINALMELNLLWLQGWGPRGNAPSVQTTVPSTHNPLPFPISATIMSTKTAQVTGHLKLLFGPPNSDILPTGLRNRTSLKFPTWLYVLLKTQRAPSQHLTEYDQTMFYQKWIIPIENW